MRISKGLKETCDKCGHVRALTHTVIGCDMCGHVIPEQEYPLTATVYQEKLEDNEEHQFCCWGCLLEFVVDLKADLFIELPTLDFETSDKARSAAGFWEAIDEFQIENES